MMRLLRLVYDTSPWVFWPACGVAILVVVVVMHLLIERTML